jgi:hypothetical protein
LSAVAGRGDGGRGPNRRVAPADSERCALADPVPGNRALEKPPTGQPSRVGWPRWSGRPGSASAR